MRFSVTVTSIDPIISHACNFHTTGRDIQNCNIMAVLLSLASNYLTRKDAFLSIGIARAYAPSFSLHATDFPNKSAIMHRRNTTTTMRLIESGLRPVGFVIDRDRRDRKSVKRPIVVRKKDIARSVAGKNFEFSPRQLGCTIFRSALPERRRHRVERTQTLAAYNRPPHERKKIVGDLAISQV